MVRAIFRAGFMFLVVMLCGAPRSHSLAPTVPLSQAAHTAWRVQDNFYSGIPQALAQTQDGYLWIGTTTGLARFDGLQFVSWEQVTGEPSLSSGVLSLLGASDGALWIGTERGLLRWDGKHLQEYKDHTGHIFDIIETADHAIWIGRGRSGDSDGPLCQVRGATLSCHGATEGLHSSFASTIAQDEAGAFWIGTVSELIRWTPQSAEVFKLSPRGRALAAIGGIIPESDGTILLGIGGTGKGAGLQSFRKGQMTESPADGIDTEKIDIEALLRDKAGATWCATANAGLVRIYQGRAESYRKEDGLSGNAVSAVLEDREGNIWIATAAGLDRLRDLSVRPVFGGQVSQIADVNAVLPLRDGTVLVNGLGSLFLLHHGTFSAVKGIPGSLATSLFEDRSNRLWAGFDDGLYLQSRGRFIEVQEDGIRRAGEVNCIVQDREGDVWAITGGKTQTLLRVPVGSHRAYVVHTSGVPTAIVPDPVSGVLVGMQNSDVARYVGANLAAFHHLPLNGSRRLWDLAAGPGGYLFVATEAGVYLIDGSKFIQISDADASSCNTAYVVTFSPNGDLWATTPCGVKRYRAGEIDDPMVLHAGFKFHPEVFSSFDGAHPTRRSRSPAAFFDTKGLFWFTSSAGLSVLDYEHLHRNLKPPPVHIEVVEVDHKLFAKGPLQISPGAHVISFTYTALSLSVPQKIQFRYKLIGYDTVWQDAGSRRQASYMNLPSGHYQFQVIASKQRRSVELRGRLRTVLLKANVVPDTLGEDLGSRAAVTSHRLPVQNAHSRGRKRGCLGVPCTFSGEKSRRTGST